MDDARAPHLFTAWAPSTARIPFYFYFYFYYILLLPAYPSTSTSTAYFYCLHTTAFKPLICSTATHFLGACQFFQGLLRLICDSDYCPSKLLPFIACIYTGAFSSGFSLSRGALFGHCQI